MRLRLLFEKKGPIRFTSHKDVMRIFQRCFATCEIPVAYSEGFHPHMRMSFGPPLRTGWESDAEFMDVHVVRPPGPLADCCNARLPDGLRIKHVAIVPEDAPKLAADICAAKYEIDFPADDVPDMEATPTDTVAYEAAIKDRIQRHTAGAEDSERPQAFDVEVAAKGDGIGLKYTSTMLAGRVVSPNDVIELAVGDVSAVRVPPRVRRLAQYVERGGAYLSPVDKGVFRGI